MGYHISIAPAITRDLRKWFENAGWQSRANWPKAASAIFDLFFAVVEKEDWEAFPRFEEKHELSKGFKAGFVTPALHSLKPKLRIINMLVGRQAI
ncbi:MAG: hypothetical protein NTY23_07775 [Chloroflexi bacterium]|nr:hypothetical protein [Chloroflexota bacterium]